MRSAVAPVYLFVCLIVGGSTQAIWQNMILQLLGLLIIAWAAAAPSQEQLSASAKLIFLIAIAAIALVALQQLPLPPRLWEQHAKFAEGYRLLGRPRPALPISLTPYESLSSLLCIIPPLAMLCAILRLKAFRPVWLAAALLGGTVAGILLGALQVASIDPDSSWYPYAETNIASSAGFFANANHMASLLVIAVPFVAAIAAAGRSRNIPRYSALLMVLMAVMLVLIVGIALNGSLVGFALAVPVLAASALILLRPASRLRTWLALLVALSVIAAVGALVTGAIGSSRNVQDASASVQSREVILQTTGRAIVDHLPLGTGLGSFVKVYRLYERPDSVTSEYVVHAHNDYAELALELGAPGIILMLLFLGWWAIAVWTVWRKGEGRPFARAASIATAAVLVQSLVDFPLRTAAISACFAMCLALLADRRTSPRQDATDLRLSRHLVFT
jgi:O-antigen ligase